MYKRQVYEEKQYDYDRKKYIKLGYAYTQQANIKFDYSMNILSLIHILSIENRFKEEKH